MKRVSAQVVVAVSILRLPHDAQGAPGACSETELSDRIVLRGACALTGDRVLGKFLELASDTVLDCRGHALRPLAAGTEGPNESQPSVPSTPVAAIFIHSAANVAVQGCTVAGFDFGIVVADDKAADERPDAPTRIRIAANDLRPLYQAITIIQADGIEVTGNHLAPTSGSSVGAWVVNDSDHVTFRDNHFDGSAEKPTRSPLFPGAPDVAFATADGLDFGQPPIAAGEPFEVRLGKTHLTFSNDVTQRSAYNLVEGNTFNQPAQRSKLGGTVAVGAYELQEGMIIRNNTIYAADVGVFVGSYFHRGEPALWPHDVLVENNVLLGPFSYYGMNIRDSFHPTVRGNLITGVPIPGAGGMKLHGKALETATVTRNRLHGNGVGIRLNQQGATFFGARVYLNDITGSLRKPIESESQPWEIPTDLSFGGQGNYWGHTCAESEGFVEHHEPQPDTTISLVVDSHPYGVPVATLDDPDLAALSPCR